MSFSDSDSEAEEQLAETETKKSEKQATTPMVKDSAGGMSSKNSAGRLNVNFIKKHNPNK